MGRGRAKAKQTRVARDLKYRDVRTDLTQLQRELQQDGVHANGHSAEAPSQQDDDADDDELYAKYADDDDDDDYDSEDDLFSRHTRFWSELNLTHPVAVKRVKELMEWVQTGAYDRILVDDSKVVYSSGKGLTGLERGVFSLFGLQ